MFKTIPINNLIIFASTAFIALLLLVHFQLASVIELLFCADWFLYLTSLKLWNILVVRKVQSIWHHLEKSHSKGDNTRLIMFEMALEEHGQRQHMSQVHTLSQKIS